MGISKINSQDVIFALDIGTRTVIGSVGVVKDKKFHIIAESYVEHEERAMIDGQIHDISLVANAVNKVKIELEEKLNINLNSVSIAAAGRFLKTTITKADLKIEYDREIDKDIIRSLELTAVKKAEEEVNEQMKGKLYCVGYSVKNYFLNGYIMTNLLSHKGEKIEAEVIATFLPRSVVDSLYSVMNKVGLDVMGMTLEPIAAMEAVIPKNLRLLNLALIDIGAGTSDIAISNKDSISAYGMVPVAGDEITENISQNYLVDFNTAEKMKKECSKSEKVKYIDVLGIENEVKSQEIIDLIEPVVEKVADEAGKKVVELNGGKSPNAIFLVGGGAYTPKLREKLSEKLQLPIQRIGIKERESITQCVCEDNTLGSVGVTVLGIALTSIKKIGHDFIDVILNGSIISLFNSHKHTVMDVMLQAGINSKVLIGRNGKNVRFNLNGIKRVAFGSLAENAIIKINQVISSIDSEVKEGDNIQVEFAKDGIDAQPKIKDYIQKLNSVTFFMNDIIQNLDPIGIINNEVVDLEKQIKEGNDVQIIFPETLEEFLTYKFNNNEDLRNNKEYYVNGNKIQLNYKIKEGDRIFIVDIKEENKNIDYEEEEIIKNDEEEEIIKNDEEEEIIKNDDEIDNDDENKEVAITLDEEVNDNNIDNKESKDINEINVIVNEENIKLTGKEKYIFVDVFNYVQFDLSSPKGQLQLLINGRNAGYYDTLSEGDNIQIKWSEDNL